MNTTNPIKVDLHWQLIPMYIYQGLAAKTGKDAYYNPFFGKGIYLHILSGNRDKQLYGVGMSDSEIGNRLMHHYYGIMGEKDDYWIPLITDPADTKLYLPGMEWGNKSSDEARRSKAAQSLVEYSYFAIAPLPTLPDGDGTLSHAEKLRDIEAILQHAFVKYRGLEEQETNADWYGRIGCRRRDLSGMTQSYELVSHYSNGTIEQFLSPNIPPSVRFAEGKIILGH